MDASNYFIADAMDDCRDFAGFDYPFPTRPTFTPVDTDPQFVAIVDTCTAMIDAMAMQAFVSGFVQAQRAASERRPYVAVVGSRNKLRHSLHQTGVLS